jgi:spore coat polysaccharide biosynthesis protein SpsF
MTSSRLPGKVLADLEGRPLLDREIERLRRMTRIDEICVATTTNAQDDPVVAFCADAGVRCFRGSEHDVLDRFVGTARETQADLIARVTADCPLLDPVIADRVVEVAETHAGDVDYVSNVLRRTFPRGLDVEVFPREVLERVAREATSKPAREHVTWYIHVEHPELFRLRGVEQDVDDSDLRWTVDTAEDLAVVRRVFQIGQLATRQPTLRELVALTRADPAATANRDVAQKTH